MKQVGRSLAYLVGIISRTSDLLPFSATNYMGCTEPGTEPGMQEARVHMRLDKAAGTRVRRPHNLWI